MSDESQRPDEGKTERDRAVPPSAAPLEEAVGALIRVKKPEGKANPKKAQPRKREKRNVDPRG